MCWVWRRGETIRRKGDTRGAQDTFEKPDSIGWQNFQCFATTIINWDTFSHHTGYIGLHMLCGTIAKNKQSTPPSLLFSFMKLKKIHQHTMPYLQNKIKSLKQLVSPFSKQDIQRGSHHFRSKSLHAHFQGLNRHCWEIHFSEHSNAPVAF